MTPRSVPPAATLLGQELREVSARSVVPSAAVNVVPSSGIVMASVAAFATATCTRVKWLGYVTFSTGMGVVDGDLWAGEGAGVRDVLDRDVRSRRRLRDRFEEPVYAGLVPGQVSSDVLRAG